MKRLVLIVAILMGQVVAYAQHEHHNMPAKKAAPAKKPLKKLPAQKASQPTPMRDDMDMKVEEHDMHEHTIHDTMQHSMSHAFSLNLPMNRNASGTGWLPDNSPMYGKMMHADKWMFMLHGNIFLRYNKQDLFDKGSRGDAKVDAPNWLMLMGQRKVGKRGLFHFSSMFSLDAAIAGGSGYPLLFQSGETWKGQPLVDRQHPHDLFSELSVSYAYAINQKTDVFAYLGYPGEPSSGSVAFMHRPSALTNPDAPISHHWNDGTHITFGVATLGVRYGKFKLEGSSFTGREPDENRWNFDRPTFDSWSGRLSFNPNKHWTIQASQAYIKSPEALHANENINRTTASVLYSQRVGKDQFLNATAIWGLNKTAGHDGEQALLLEASYALNRWNIYGRYEWVQKSVEELNLDETVYGAHTFFPVNAVTLGSNYDIIHVGMLRIAAGAQASLYAADSKLDGLYGNNPMAGQVYLRFYPTLMDMN